MRKSLVFVSIVAMLSLGVNSCKESQKEKKLTNTELDSVLNLTLVYQDSLDNLWKKINQTDSQKLADIKTLLYQISLTKSPDISKVELGVKKWNDLVALRYNQNEVGDYNKVDLFDNACDSLIRFVSDLKANTPGEANYPLLDELLADIHANNSLDLAARLRSHYNKWGESYNELVEELLKSKHPKAASLRKKPIYGYAE